MSLLEVKNLTKLCSDCFGIDDISFTVKEKGVYGFFGKSGCGKSVLASVLGGMSDADSGEVLYKELDLLAAAILQHCDSVGCGTACSQHRVTNDNISFLDI